MQTAKKENQYAIVIIGLLFFVFGFVTWLNGTLIPFLKLACQLNNDIQAFFVTFAFYMAYFFLAIPSSMILKKTGFKNGMSLAPISPVFKSELKKIGDQMLEDWLKKAGPDGKKVIDAYYSKLK